MKNLVPKLLLVAFLLSFFVFSCNKATGLEPQKTASEIFSARIGNGITSEGSKKIDEVVKMEGESQKIAYQDLNPLEKWTIWQERLDGAIASDEFTKNEKKEMVNLKKDITVDVFSDGFPKENKMSLQNKYNHWKKKPSLVELCTSIGKNPNSARASALTKTCWCSSTSMFSCENCVVGDCKYTRVYCGFMFLWECDGICAPPIHPI